MLRIIFHIAVSLIPASAIAAEMKITKFSKAGSGEYYTGLYFKMPKKSVCIMELHSDLGAADPQTLDAHVCKNVEKLIKRIGASPRDLRFVRQNCPVSFEEIVLDSKARLYCIKGRKSDGKAVRHLNRYLSALSAKHLRVDF